MRNKEKYHGIVPSLYACYDSDGCVSTLRTKNLARHLAGKGVAGVYVGGSAGECIYQTVEERKLILEAVTDEIGAELPIFAHVACNSIEESRILAAHAQQQGVTAIFAIPPIYFRLPEAAIADYWNEISMAAPDTDFFIYNIPQLAGVSLTVSLLQKMKQNPRLAGVKNSSMPVQDIQMWLDEGEDLAVFNGPDEQLLSGLAAGACGGIGGTYAVMPELFLKIYELFQRGENQKARQIQNEVCRIIYKMCSTGANLYGVMKELLRRSGIDVGSVRRPLRGVGAEDMLAVCEAEKMIRTAMDTYC